MAQFFDIHPANPQPRLIKQAAELLRKGGVLAIPTDSHYALVAMMDDKKAVDTIRQLRGIDERRLLALLVPDLSELGKLAKVDNKQYRLLKLATPGPFTFVMEATREVPRRLAHPSRKTIGLRVPDHTIVHALLAETGPLLSSTLTPAGDDEPMQEVEDIRDRLQHALAGIIDGPCPHEVTTMIDLTGDEPVVTRLGRGDPASIGIVGG